MKLTDKRFWNRCGNAVNELFFWLFIAFAVLLAIDLWCMLATAIVCLFGAMDKSLTLLKISGAFGIILMLFSNFTLWLTMYSPKIYKRLLSVVWSKRLIFSTSMADRLQDDSLRVYLVKYHDILGAYYNRNNAEEAVLQHTVYNYSQHERARSEAEREQAIAELKSHQRLAWVIVFASATIILLLTSIMFYEMQRRRRSELEVARNKVIQAEETMNRYDVETHQCQELIVTLRQSYEKGLRTPLVGSMRDSCVYRELKRRLEAGSLMNDSDPYWKEMESMISEVFPKFKETLICLTGDNLSLLDWHVAILIKCRISQSDMARLLGVGRSAITHRLSSLSKKVFGNEANSRMITGAILLIS